MLRISKKADYAVFLLGCIAREGAYPGGPAEESVISAQEIARQAGLNKSVVANLLKECTRQGLLASTRGLKGGYRLVKHPSEVDLAEILHIVEGPFLLVDCLKPGPRAASGPGHGGDGRCSLTSFCPSKNPMQIVHERIAELFASIRLDELCGMAAATGEGSPVSAGADR
ncbi:MAG: SUF system Fe-S cluster assembly regulator [Planctomycetota bacterium]